MEPEKLLTTTEVAAILGVTHGAVNTWLKAGDFPNAYRINPSRPKSGWRIPASDVDAFKQKRREQRGFIRLPVAPVAKDDPAAGK